MSRKPGFTSERLFYRAVESGDKDFFHDFETSPGSSTGNPGLLLPVSRTDSAKIHTMFSTALLGVMICLPGGPSRESLVQEGIVDDGIPIGFMALTERMQHSRVGVFAIALAEKYQRKGYAREAMEWCLHWGFMQAQMHRIQLVTGSFNEPAIKLYEKVGMKLEGRARECVWREGEWHDQLTYGMLEDEWGELHKKK